MIKQVAQEVLVMPLHQQIQNQGIGRKNRNISIINICIYNMKLDRSCREIFRRNKNFANEILSWRNSSRFVENYTLIIRYIIWELLCYVIIVVITLLIIIIHQLTCK